MNEYMYYIYLIAAVYVVTTWLYGITDICLSLNSKEGLEEWQKEKEKLVQSDPLCNAMGQLPKILEIIGFAIYVFLLPGFLPISWFKRIFKGKK